MRIVFINEARRQLRAIPRNQALMILHRLAAMVEEPANPLLDIVKLAGRKGYRLRVGRYRVIFELGDETVVVTAVGHRREVYRGK